MTTQTNSNNDVMFPNQQQMPFFAASQPTTAMYANQNPVVFSQNSYPTSHYPPQTITPTTPIAGSNSSQIPSAEQQTQQVLIFNDQHRPNSRSNRCTSYGEDNGHLTGGHDGRPASLRGFMINSSQNSTATTSPATSVHPNFGQQNPRMCRQLSDSHPGTCSYVPNNLVMMRPVSNFYFNCWYSLSAWAIS